ncbi:PREDICTED: probable elongation factor 1-delta isoform X2 [Dinoponera quadriceps]|uniref:Probable elongation factor 1-delta isoform X2 n=1 Tax=Dinoponera quadriceps TaxID=609295 RepID=A0A6P3XF94_DINQU|nr:PREDICTED: probable elongation factor 1-delta isoform X2 [Dinoponera quadriceps]
MATATVVTAALAQEKIWLDKPSYDKAERQYFEKMAKVVSRKVAGGCTLKCDNLVTDKYQDLISTNTLKSKAEKSKDNKSLAFENETNENAKRSKCQARNTKTNKDAVDVCNMQNKQNLMANEKSNSAKDNVKEKESISPNGNSKKYNAKEAKEKKNKEDTKNKSRENGGNDIGGNKETSMPFARNKEQLPEQGTQQSNCAILPPVVGSLANEVAKARQHIKQSLQCMDDVIALTDMSHQDVTPRIANIEKHNKELQDVVQDLEAILDKLEKRVTSLEQRIPYIAICPARPESVGEQVEQQPEKNEDDEVDLFGSDSEADDEEAAKIREERLAAYAAKKSKKPALIAKSNIILDVKPWDDETEMKEMENEVRKIETDGLFWGASKLVPLAFGIHKLQISCVVEDDKVSVDWLTEKIQEIEDYVQSVDIAAFNKV